MTARQKQHRWKAFYKLNSTDWFGIPGVLAATKAEALRKVRKKHGYNAAEVRRNGGVGGYRVEPAAGAKP